MPKGFVTLDVRQSEIKNDQVRLLRQHLQRGFAIGRFQDFAALRGEPHAKELANRALIIDHKDLGRSGTHAAASIGSTDARTESMIVNAPTRSVQFTAGIVPCIDSTKSREIARLARPRTA